MRRLTVSALFLMLFSLLAASPLAAQTIVVNPEPIVFQVQAGASATQLISVTVTPAQAWTISTFTGLPSLLSVTKISDTQASVTVNTTGVDPLSVPTAYVVITAGTQTHFTPVNLTINAAASSQVTVSPTTLTFSAQQGSVATSKAISITSTGSSAVPYTVSATSAQGWLSASPSSGTAGVGSGAASVVTVSATPGSLSVGGYDGIVTITPVGVTNPVPVQVSVHVDITGVPQINLDKTALSFPWQMGTAAPATQTIHVTVANSSVQVPVFVSIDQQNSDLSGSWLVISGGSGTYTPTDIQVSISSSVLNTLLPKKYNGRILITAPTLSTTPIAVPVTLTVSQVPILLSSTNSLQFSMPATGALPAGQKFTLSSTSGALGYTVSFASSSGAWLSLSPLNGTTTSDVQVAVNSLAQSLPAGTYTGTITAAPSNGSDAQTVAVTLKVIDTPVVTTTPGSMTFVYQTGKALPANQLLAVGSSGAAQTFTAAVSTTSGGNWLTLYSGTGAAVAPTDVLTTGTTMAVGVNVSALAAGTYSGSITLTPQNGGAPATVVPVTLQVSANALLVLTPSEINLTFQPGGATTSTTNISVNTTSDLLNFSVSSAVNNGFGWLFTSSSASTPSNVSVYVSVGNLSAGTYTGSVTITPSNGGPSQVVPVKVSVSAGSLSVSPSTLTFSQVAGAAAPAAQPLSITNGASGGAALPFSATVSAGAPGGWLSIDKSSGSTPSTINVSVAAGLSAGTYTGSITITSPGAVGSPQTIGVTLNVSQAQTIALSANSLVFSGSMAQLPGAQNVSVTTTAAQALNYTATAAVSTPVNASWLAVTPASGPVSATSPVALAISIVPTELAKLAPGTYNGTVTVAATGASNSPQTISVTLIVPNVSIIVPTSPLSFSGTVSQVPASQSVSLQGSSAGVTFKAAASTGTGGNWLTVTPTDGTMPATITVSIVPSVLAGLQPGTYNGSVTITSPNTSNSPQTIPVVLTVGASAPVVSKIVNAASYVAAPIAGGEILYIEGTDMGPADLQLAKPNPGFPTTLSQVRVLFDGTPAPIIYVQKTKISVVAPWFINAQASTNVQVEYNGQRSDVKAMRIGATAPGIFSTDSSGTGQGAILNQDYSYNGTGSGQQPAAKGSVVQVFGTGGGVTNPAGIDGAQTPVALTPLLANTTALVGGVPAMIQYSGAAPGLISGLVQVNVIIPDNAPSGAVPLVILIGGIPTQANITVAVR